jgi:ribosomal protein L11 methyltransferase
LTYPALDVRDADGELVLAVADDYSPTAVEERDGSLTIYFSDRRRRDQALEAVVRAFPNAQATPREVDDEDWARRSQENLGPVTVGRIIVFPNSQALSANRQLPILNRDSIAVGPCAIAIPPSMAFGTGHHATTRLCLAALQLLNLAGTVVLDVGTGSGILAIGARKLGAAAAIGIDNDPDAVDCARANLQLNPTVDNVSFELVDFAEYAARSLVATRPDVVTANLTGALLCRIAPVLAQAFAPGGALIVSGALAEEQASVAAAFRDLDVVWEQTEDEWVGMGFARFER